jgi:hypothetical protein
MKGQLYSTTPKFSAQLMMLLSCGGRESWHDNSQKIAAEYGSGVRSAPSIKTSGLIHGIKNFLKN